MRRRKAAYLKTASERLGCSQLRGPGLQERIRHHRRTRKVLVFIAASGTGGRVARRQDTCCGRHPPANAQRNQAPWAAQRRKRYGCITDGSLGRRAIASDFGCRRDVPRGGASDRVRARTHGVTYFNDSKATNVDATLKAIEAFAEPLWLILGGKDKGGSYEPLVQPSVIRPKACC